jgi:tryptophan synthase alpha chain
MSRLTELFKHKKNSVLNVYCTAGYPQLESTSAIMLALQDYGADIIELGIPYSDPLADGPVIQESSRIALENGMNMSVLFSQLKMVRERINLPVVLMGYMNPVLQYGFEKFCKDAARAGVDGLILPDLPPTEFETEYKKITRQYGLDFIFLVTPETGPDRIKKLDSLSSGFLYAVSSSSTTGGQQDMGLVTGYLEKLKKLDLTNPVLVGFGIDTKDRFDAVCKIADGGIIGSAYIKALKDSKDVKATTKSFLSSILKA